MPFIVLFHVPIIGMGNFTVFPVLVNRLFVTGDFRKFPFLLFNGIHQFFGLAFYQRGPVDPFNGLCVIDSQINLLLNCIEDSSLQAVMLDGVFCASRFRLVFIGTAIVIHHIPDLAPGHSLATVRAFQKAAEQIELFLLGPRPGVPNKKPLYFFKGFPVNDCLVGVFNDIPLVLRDNFLNVYLVAFHAVTALHHIPAVHTVF